MSTGPERPGLSRPGRVLTAGTDRGSATLFLAGFIAFVLLLTTLAVALAVATAASTRARTAADLAALAGAGALLQGQPTSIACARAAATARRNGALSVRCEVLPGAGGHGDVAVRAVVDVPMPGLGPASARAQAGTTPVVDP